MQQNKLGHYIHYRKSAYERYGIGRRGQGGYNKNIGAIIQSQRSEIDKLIKGLDNDVQAKELENFLNNLRETGNLAGGSTDQNALQNIANQYYNILQEHAKHLENKVNFSTAGINSQRGGFALEGLKEYKNLQGTKRGRYKGVGVTIQTLQNIKKDLTNAIGKIQKQINNGTLTVNNWQDERQAILNITKSLKTYIKQAEAQGYKNTGTIQYSSELGVNINNILKQYNELVQVTKTPTLKDLGDVAEIQVALFGKIIENEGYNISNDLIKKAIVGSNSANMSIDLSHLGESAIKQHLNKLNIEINDGLEVNIASSSQQTVDVIFNMKNINDGMQEIRASVKNYENATVKGRSISILNGSNLLNILGMAQGNFANHYLNLITQHSPQPGKITDQPFEEMEQTLKGLIMVRGLVGYRGKNSDSKFANTFIVNDRSGGKAKFRVYQVKDLAETAWRDIEEYTTLKDGTKLPRLGEVKNTWSSVSPEMRIASVLAQVHSYKISMSLKSELLQQKKV